MKVCVCENFWLNEIPNVMVGMVAAERTTQKLNENQNELKIQTTNESKKKQTIWTLA